MGATLIVDDPELVPILSGTHLATSKGWEAELAQQREKVGRSVGMTSMGNRIRVARIVAQWFTHYATTAFKKGNLFMRVNTASERYRKFPKKNGLFTRSLLSVLMKGEVNIAKNITVEKSQVLSFLTLNCLHERYHTLM